MLFTNVGIPGGKEQTSSIRIEGSKIISVGNDSGGNTGDKSDVRINFDGALAFPGLINSHDHLEFNLYPQLADKVYEDYIEWGKDIHLRYSEEIDRVRNVPYPLRYKWGLYKNLLCGVTTVVHHGNGPTLAFRGMPEHYQYYQYLHSVKLHKGWRLKLNTSFNSDPIVIHIGEGTNRSSFKEINNLVKWNLAGKKIVGIHGISMTEKQSKQFLGLVWCPVSNYSLYNKSADIRLLKTHTDILFGTDSTLTGDWNLWNHLRFARKLGDLSDVELYNGITTTAARLWKTNSPYAIAPDGSADIVIAKRKFEDEWESFYSLNPEDLLLVLKKGEIILLDRELGDSVKILQTDKYDLISINAVQKYVTRGIKELAGLINGYLPAYRFPFSII